MKKNIGITDRLMRAIIAMTICFLYIANAINGVTGGLLLIFAVIVAFTSLLGTCPLYRLIGVSTNKEVQEE
jgi:hypothetical protein